MRRLSIQVNRRSGARTNVSVGVVLVLLVVALLSYRLAIGGAADAARSLPAPARRWTVPLTAPGLAAATMGETTFILTTDKLGDAALVILNADGLLIRTESLASRGRHELVATALGMLCVGRDDGKLALYRAGGARGWRVTLAGPIALAAADQTGVSVVVGPNPGGPVADRLITLDRSGAVVGQWAVTDGAITGLARGGGATVAAVFSADPQSAAEMLVFVAADGTRTTVKGNSYGAACLAANGETLFAASGGSLAAFATADERRWRVSAEAPLALTATATDLVVADGTDLIGYDAANGKVRWHRVAPASAAAVDATGAVLAGDTGLTGYDTNGQPQWHLTGQPTAWAFGQGLLVVLEKETAIAYRTR